MVNIKFVPNFNADETKQCVIKMKTVKIATV